MVFQQIPGALPGSAVAVRACIVHNRFEDWTADVNGRVCREVDYRSTRVDARPAIRVGGRARRAKLDDDVLMELCLLGRFKVHGALHEGRGLCGRRGRGDLRAFARRPRTEPAAELDGWIGCGARVFCLVIYEFVYLGSGDIKVRLGFPHFRRFRGIAGCAWMSARCGSRDRLQRLRLGRRHEVERKKRDEQGRKNSQELFHERSE